MKTFYEPYQRKNHHEMWVEIDDCDGSLIYFEKDHTDFCDRHDARPKPRKEEKKKPIFKLWDHQVAIL